MISMASDPIRQGFAGWLRDELRTREVSVSDFAARIGVSPAAVYRWTAGQRLPADAQIARLVDVLDVSPEAVMGALSRSYISLADLTVVARSVPAPAATESAAADAHFATWLRAELATRGWSVGALARRLGVGIASVRAWTKGGRTPASAQLPGLAEALGVSIEAIQGALNGNGVVSSPAVGTESKVSD
jgi:transcriptional regulator with XRE-family HTH domain